MQVVTAVHAEAPGRAANEGDFPRAHPHSHVFSLRFSHTHQWEPNPTIIFDVHDTLFSFPQSLSSPFFNPFSFIRINPSLHFNPVNASPSTNLNVYVQ